MNSTEAPPDISSWPNCVATLLMVLNIVLTLFFSGSIIYLYVFDGSQRTSFNFMCAVRATNNIVAMIGAFFLVYVPAAVLGASLFPPWLDSILVCISLNVYIYNEFQSIYISANRFIAIYFPVYYNKLCGLRPTVYVHLLLYADRLRNVGIETFYRTTERNFIRFSPEILMFTSVEVYGGGLVFMGAVMFFGAFSINILTFMKIILFYAKRGSRSDKESMVSIKKNIKLFLQTIVQDILFFIDSFFTFYMMQLFQHRFWSFICATYVWQSIHVIDGLVMLMFNDRLSLLKNAFSSNSAPVSVVEISSVRVAPRRLPVPDVS